MKPIYKIPFVFLIPIVILLYANSSGSIGGKTGSPGDFGATCVECHTGGSANAVSGWISSNIPASGYTPGETYQITVTGTHNGVMRFGFELTSENISNAKVGTFTITDPGRTKLVNQNRAVTHTFGGTSVSGNTSNWSVNWTAPSTDIGQIRFYAAVNAANGNGNTLGDVIYTTSLFVNAALPPALVSIEPHVALIGETIEALITGENTSWVGTTPEVKLSKDDSSPWVIDATSVEVLTNTTLSAVFEIPNEGDASGVYDLNVDDLTLPESFVVTFTESVESFSVSRINLYPNPASDMLWVNAALSGVVNIYDTNGRLMNSHQIAEGRQSISLQGYNRGIYIVEILTNSGRFTEKLLVK